jgi:hypothetical protein
VRVIRLDEDDQVRDAVILEGAVEGVDAPDEALPPPPAQELPTPEEPPEDEPEDEGTDDATPLPDEEDDDAPPPTP